MTEQVADQRPEIARLECPHCWVRHEQNVAALRTIVQMAMDDLWQERHEEQTQEIGTPEVLVTVGTNLLPPRAKIGFPINCDHGPGPRPPAPSPVPDVMGVDLLRFHVQTDTGNEQRLLRCVADRFVGREHDAYMGAWAQDGDGQVTFEMRTPHLSDFDDDDVTAEVLLALAAGRLPVTSVSVEYGAASD